MRATPGTPWWRKRSVFALIVLFAALALVAVACTSSDDSGDSDTTAAAASGGQAASGDVNAAREAELERLRAAIEPWCAARLETPYRGNPRTDICQEVDPVDTAFKEGSSSRYFRIVTPVLGILFLERVDVD